jgi:hypothetical protein
MRAAALQVYALVKYILTQMVYSSWASSHCWTCRAAASHNNGKTKVKAMCYLFSFSEALQCSRRDRHVFFSICLSRQWLNAGMWKYVSDPKGATILKTHWSVDRMRTVLVLAWLVA